MKFIETKWVLLFLASVNIACAQSYHAIAIGIKDKVCQSGKVQSTFQEDEFYFVQTGSEGERRGDTAIRARKSLNDMHRYDETKIRIVSGVGLKYALIEYNKKVSGWNCTLKKYAVGFGDTPHEAVLDAVRKKNLDDKASKHTLVKTN
ncbi:hypothetical protein [Luteolibacter marinus]|uniref:hypothetical protein n=1 Tax=Luteolibacter marinus TaxID=2776705 RepID=UPI001867593A|nr:hypothetical protein [Luteolibacter marinus]